MDTRKNFIHINENFNCKHCGKTVSKLKSGCRNHCPHCLYSLHVDETIPGDRLSKCLGLMAPTNVDYSGKKGYMIMHTCTVCKKQIRNKAADDDNIDILIELTRPL